MLERFKALQAGRHHGLGMRHVGYSGLRIVGHIETPVRAWGWLSRWLPLRFPSAGLACSLRRAITTDEAQTDAARTRRAFLGTLQLGRVAAIA